MRARLEPWAGNAWVALRLGRKYFVDVLPSVQDSHDFWYVTHDAIEQDMGFGRQRSDSRSQLIARAST